MRSAVAFALLAVVGCNEVFGIKSTTPVDATDAPPDAAPDRVKLTFQVAQTMNGATPDPTLLYPAIEPPPVVRVGPLDGPLADAEYLAGEIAYPRELIGTKWRIEYTLPGGVPHEVQWTTPEGGAAHLVAPVFGRLDRTPAPPDSGFAPMTAFSRTFTNGRVFTTGIWTETLTGAVNPPAVAFGPQGTSVVPLSGPMGAPDAASGDAAVILDYGPSTPNNCLNTTFSAGFDVPALEPSTISMVAQPAGATGNRSMAVVTTGGGLALLARVKNVLGTRHPAAQTPTGHNVIGLAPSTLMPAFTHRLGPLADPLIGALDGPMMIPLSECPFGFDNSDQYSDPLNLGFPTIGVGYAVSSRQPDSATPVLYSGISAVGVDPPSSETIALDFRVPFAVAPITLDNGADAPLDLADGADHEFLPAGPFRLQFGHEDEDDPGLQVDYYEVVLHRVQRGVERKLIPVRVYVLPDPAQRELVFDPAPLAPDFYVFSIHAYRGRPMARLNDFRAVEYPQASTTVFTRTFRKM